MNNLKQFILKHPIITTILPYSILLIINHFGTKLVKIDAFYRPLTLVVLIGLLLVFLYQNIIQKETVFINWGKPKQLYFYLYPIIFLIFGLIIIAITDKINVLDFKYFIKNLAVGITEEFMFRSICFGLLIRLYMQNGVQNAVFKAGIYSSLAFGLFHSVNILQNPTSVELWIATGTQLIYATLLGIGFAGFTYKTGSIAVPILIHTVIDIFGDEEIFAPQTKEYFSQLSILVVVFGLAFTILGFIFLKNSKNSNKVDINPV